MVPKIAGFGVQCSDHATTAQPQADAGGDPDLAPETQHVGRRTRRPARLHLASGADVGARAATPALLPGLRAELDRAVASGLRAVLMTDDCQNRVTVPVLTGGQGFGAETQQCLREAGHRGPCAARIESAQGWIVE